MSGKLRLLYAWVESFVYKHNFKGPGMSQTMCEECNVNTIPVRLTLVVRGEGI